MRMSLIALLAVGAFVASTRTAAASNAVIVIPFEKHWVGPGHYVGTACDGGSIDMQLSNSSVTGDVQHFTATVQVALPGRSLTAVLDGSFNFSTGKTVLNGAVVDGWLAGARVHEEGRLVGFDPLTFVGTVQLMPSSAD
ncbi:MAG TPA: hypothetical protein VE688_08170 [Gaiellaceae bacterium]|nr:hypothetical protein [Gaiellaceae bacterium]